MRHAGRQLGAIALLAILMRAIVPGGYMLATGDASEGRYLIVQLCDGHAATPKVINLETGQEVDLKNPSKEAPQDGKGGHPVCVFAAAPGVALPGATSEPVVKAAQRDVDHAVVKTVRAGRGIAAPPPPSTGPPVEV